MSKIDAMLVVGARPQFIKSAPLIGEILSKHRQIRLTIVHSGQHYDPQMSQIFFRELKIPTPFINLRAASGSHATQTSTIMKRLERLILKLKPDVVVVPGDTNTTLAAALAASKLCVPVAHVEAGLRSGDMTMPEEINRKVTDHCSALLLAPTRTAVLNLGKEGLKKSTHLTGDTMVDALRMATPIVQRKQDIVLDKFGLLAREYVLVTLHRPSNVDDPSRLTEIQLALRKVATRMKVVFPAHPRTRTNLTKLRALRALQRGGVKVIPPQGYVETLSLLNNANCLLTDSGGMQKESFLLHVPCITLRSSTEWPETLEYKANQLVVLPRMISKTIVTTISDKKLRERIRHLRSPFGDGHASAAIARLLQDTVGTR